MFSAEGGRAVQAQVIRQGLSRMNVATRSQGCRAAYSPWLKLIQLPQARDTQLIETPCFRRAPIPHLETHHTESNTKTSLTNVLDGLPRSATIGDFTP